MKMELNNTKRFNIICVLLILLSIFLISCKKQNVENDPNKDKDIEIDYTVYPEEMIGIIRNKKVYVTSIGQSSDISEYQEVVLDHIDYFEYEINPLLKASDVEEGSCVLLFVGCSIKALAASELTIDDELQRASEFVSLRQNKKITLICFHIGGLARRGATSDQFIKALFPYSNFNIYLASGNSDKLLSDLSYKNNVYAYEISSNLALAKTTELLYNYEE